MFEKMIDAIYSSISSVPFNTLVWIIVGAFLALTAVIAVLCIAIPKIRAADKGPYMCLVNAFTAVLLAAYLTKEPLAQSILAATLFWCMGYLLYGLLSFITRPLRREKITPSAVTLMPTVTVAPPQPTDIPAVKSNVRLEHAISVTDRLLQKNLGKSDRQELEKLKSTFAVLQIKGVLSPAESDVLNENFNTLLKLMAKYNI